MKLRRKLRRGCRGRLRGGWRGTFLRHLFESCLVLLRSLAHLASLAASLGVVGVGIVRRFARVGTVVVCGIPPALAAGASLVTRRGSRRAW